MKYRLLKNYLEKFSDDRLVTGYQGKLAWHSSSLMFSKVMIFQWPVTKDGENKNIKDQGHLKVCFELHTSRPTGVSAVLL